MSLSKKGDERREYFRIKNWLIINHEAVDSIDPSLNASALLTKSSPRITLLQELTRLESENQEYLASLSAKHSQLGDYLINLNKKVELLTHFVIQSLDNDQHDLVEVDISGGGLRFKSAEAVKLDQLLKLEIVLIPECVGFVAYGRVVDCKPAEEDEGYHIALIFTKLNEKDRDAIIKHVFALQSKQLRGEIEHRN